MHACWLITRQQTGKATCRCRRWQAQLQCLPAGRAAVSTGRSVVGIVLPNNSHCQITLCSGKLRFS